LPLTTDPEVRSLVRLAIDVRDVRNELTPERRAALKLRILRRLETAHPRPLADRLAALWFLISRPLPVLSRVGTIALIVIAMVGGASAVSADSLPDDPLYSLKMHSEQVRLSLTQNAADRAAVELGIAETRLREATALTAQNRDAEADAAASSFGEYLANAAASIEEASAAESSDLVEQLRTRVAQQQTQLTQTDRPTPNAVTVIASVAKEIATVSSSDGGSIADAAARAAETAATMAKTTVDDRPTVRAAPHPALTPDQRAKLQAAAKAATLAAERARAAAERAKKAAAKKAHSHQP